MKSLNQLLLDFDYDQNFKDDDFYVGKSNFYSFELINKWPNWEKNFLNISGEKFSGKTHLTNIFLCNSQYVYGFRFIAYRWISIANYVIWRILNACNNDWICNCYEC